MSSKLLSLCSSLFLLQPYVYNSKSQVMISYDNAQSFAAKGNFIKDNNLRGFAMWEAGGDSEDILLDSIRSSAGTDGVQLGC